MPVTETKVPLILINGKGYFDPDSKLVIGEFEKVEEITGGLTFAQVLSRLEEDTTDAKCLKALVWVLMHRENPNVTLEDVSGAELDFPDPEEEKQDPQKPSVSGESGSSGSASSTT